MDGPQSFSDWVAVISTILGLLAGGGGLVAYLRYRMDQKRGVVQDVRGDSDSLNARAVAITTIQFDYLIKPLQEKVEGLEKELSTLKNLQRETDDKYRHALAHIRTLMAWIAQHFPERKDELPPLPVDLAGDI